MGDSSPITVAQGGGDSMQPGTVADNVAMCCA